MLRRVQLLLLFCLCAHLLNGIAVAAGTVLDAAVDAADGGGADLHRLDDLQVAPSSSNFAACRRCAISEISFTVHRSSKKA